MDVRLIKSNADYERALARIESLLDAEPDTQEFDELEVFAALVHLYEGKHFSIDEPDPIEFLKNCMEFKGHKQRDFAVILHSRSRATEILKRQRKLSLSHIRIIHREWGVPVEPLVREYALEA